jgi:hypothetical protein
MVAGGASCQCEICGTECTGRFAGCASVWARGPRAVAVDAPRYAGTPATGAVLDPPKANGDRWRLPLEPLPRQSAPTPTPTPTTPDATPAPVAVERAGVVTNGSSEASHNPVDYEAPDVTARFVVAELATLNERLAVLTDMATEKGDATLEKVHSELRRITSLREVDLTEQASGIFEAVQAGTDALDQFATVVNKVTTDLRAILKEALAAIGGTDGLAAWVAHSAEEVADVRQEIRNAFARIERDMSALRDQTPVKSPDVTLGDDQLTFIVEAVTESVVSALNAQQLRSSARRR